MIRVVLPPPLRDLAGISGEIVLDMGSTRATTAAVLDAIEASHPVLRGAIRDTGTGKRRPFVRFFALEQDLSLEPLDTPLPEPVANGEQPLVVLGAIAGG